MTIVAPQFRWLDEHSVHIAEFDEDHKRLFDTINELDAAVRDKEPPATIDRILDKLVNYAISHVGAEEALMEKHGFPGLAEHKTHHALFRRKVAGFAVDHQADPSGVPAELFDFMKTWLKTHVLEMDRLYAPFLNARGVR